MFQKPYKCVQTMNWNKVVLILGYGNQEESGVNYTLTKVDYLNRADFPDAIAYYSYPIDIHASMPDEGAENEKLYQNSKYKNGECYGIPYRCLIPEGFKNLAVAGRIISADRAMLSSIRIMKSLFCYRAGSGYCGGTWNESRRN